MEEENELFQLIKVPLFLCEVCQMIMVRGPAMVVEFTARKHTHARAEVEVLGMQLEAKAVAAGRRPVLRLTATGQPRRLNRIHK
jgi:hypothetical protein